MDSFVRCDTGLCSFLSTFSSFSLLIVITESVTYRPPSAIDSFVLLFIFTSIIHRRPPPVMDSFVQPTPTSLRPPALPFSLLLLFIFTSHHRVTSDPVRQLTACVQFSPIQLCNLPATSLRGHPPQNFSLAPLPFHSLHFHSNMPTPSGSSISDIHSWLEGIPIRHLRPLPHRIQKRKRMSSTPSKRPGSQGSGGPASGGPAKRLRQSSAPSSGASGAFRPSPHHFS